MLFDLSSALAVVAGLAFVAVYVWYRKSRPMTPVVYRHTNTTGGQQNSGTTVTLGLLDTTGNPVTHTLTANLADGAHIDIPFQRPAVLPKALERAMIGLASFAVLLAVVAGLAWSQGPRKASEPAVAATQDEDAVKLATAYLASLNKAQAHLDKARLAEAKAEERQRLADQAKGTAAVADALQKEAKEWINEMQTEIAQYQASKALTIEIMSKAKAKFSEAEFEKALTRYGRPATGNVAAGAALVKPSQERLPLEPPSKMDRCGSKEKDKGAKK